MGYLQKLKSEMVLNEHYKLFICVAKQLGENFMQNGSQK